MLVYIVYYTALALRLGRVPGRGVEATRTSRGRALAPRLGRVWHALDRSKDRGEGPSLISGGSAWGEARARPSTWENA